MTIQKFLQFHWDIFSLDILHIKKVYSNIAKFLGIKHKDNCVCYHTADNFLVVPGWPTPQTQRTSWETYKSTAGTSILYCRIWEAIVNSILKIIYVFFNIQTPAYWLTQSHKRSVTDNLPNIMFVTSWWHLPSITYAEGWVVDGHHDSSGGSAKVRQRVANPESQLEGCKLNFSYF